MTNESSAVAALRELVKADDALRSFDFGVGEPAYRVAMPKHQAAAERVIAAWAAARAALSAAPVSPPEPVQVAYGQAIPHFLAQALHEVCTEPSPNTINMQGWGPDGNSAGMSTTSSFDVHRDMHVMSTALDLYRAIKRGVDIDAATFFKHVVGAAALAVQPQQPQQDQPEAGA